MEEMSTDRGIESEVVRIKHVDDLQSVLARIPSSLQEGVFVWPSPVLDASARKIGAMLAEQNVVSVLPWKEYVEGGGLLSYSPDIVAIWYQASNYVDRILRGAKPSELPVTLPTAFELVINLRSAQALGLTVPVPVLLRADRVIE